MKSRTCPYCGASVTKGTCEYCGKKFPRDFEIKSIVAYQPLLKKVFTPYAIVSSILWTCCCIFNISSIAEDGFISYIGVALFGYALFIAITDLLYYKKHPIQKQASGTASVAHTSSAISPTYVASKSFDNMDGFEFEHYCAGILEENGFENVEVTKGSGDQGIDIIAHKDGIKYGIQCKCYTSDIGNKAVQEAFAGKTYYGCHIAAVITNRYFTKSAKELAEKNGVLLWDRNKLLELTGANPLVSNTPDLGHVGTVDEARKIMQPYVDSINSYYRNRRN